MVKKSTAYILLFFLCSGCFQSSDRIEITELRRTKVEKQQSVPPLAVAVRMGIAPVSTSAQHSPHGNIPLPILQEDIRVEKSNRVGEIQVLAWKSPESWQEGGKRAMRLATYTPVGATQTECAVTLLSGQAGGIPANLNRWRAQLGLKPLLEKEIDLLPQWNMLGVPAVYIDCVDASSSMVLYGVICPVPSGLLFVKMTGPLSEMESEQEHFQAFCLSMSFADEN